ncbi:hypothetical protein [Okeania sp. SIO2B3]|uniref:hypothetical protein n=1 Tax=Okeania sp. SIO2B3 TaxID=2607784 RepID=UPI0013BF5786|nr:hypothetical protein [Okeania sp. SIO2B3]NET45690.1 hypothetical protein [Okeania sp. SIO2B3]
MNLYRVRMISYKKPFNFKLCSIPSAFFFLHSALLSPKCKYLTEHDISPNITVELNDIKSGSLGKIQYYRGLVSKPLANQEFLPLL